MNTVSLRADRQLNIELLRIIAMVMVVVLHVNVPTISQDVIHRIFLTGGIASAFPPVLTEALCISAVNIFVMISGWFGIRASLRGFCNFMWQVVFIVGLSVAVGCLFMNVPLSAVNLLKIVGLYSGGGWFVASYLGLYILSPVLNAYVAQASERKLGLTVAAFFAFEILWGDTESVPFVAGGYSTFSFIGLYLFSAWLRKWYARIPRLCLPLGFFICVAVNIVLCFIALYLDSKLLIGLVFNYVNPFTIISAACALITFHNMEINAGSRMRRFILFVSASSFAIYLTHAGTDFMMARFTRVVSHLTSAWHGVMEFLVLGAFVLLVCVVSVLVDQPRRWVWNRFLCPLFGTGRKKGTASR